MLVWLLHYSEHSNYSYLHTPVILSKVWKMQFLKTLLLNSSPTTVLQSSIIANTTCYCCDKLSLVISQDILSEKSTPGLTWLHSSYTHVYTDQISRIFQGFFESKLGRKEMSLSTPYGHIAGLAALLNRTKHQRYWETAIHVRVRNIQSALCIFK